MRGTGKWGRGEKSSSEVRDAEIEVEKASQLRLVFLWTETECEGDVERNSPMTGQKKEDDNSRKWEFMGRQL